MFKVIRSNGTEVETWQTFDLFSENKHLKTSSDRRIIAIFQEIGVAESNGDARILTGSSEIAVSAHAHENVAKTVHQSPKYLYLRK